MGFRPPRAAIRFSLSASRNRRALPAAGSQPGLTPPFWTSNNGETTTMARSSDLAILVHLISDEQLNLNEKYDNSTDNSTSKKIKPPVRYVFKLRN
jgi:hypothetical protein